MALADYLDLRTAALEQAGRPDLADRFATLTKLAEVHLSRAMRSRDQITEASVTVTSGVAPLPSDFIEAIGLYNTSGYEYVQQPPQATRTSGTTTFYSVTGGNITGQLSDGSLTLQYYAAVPTITGSMTATNWLLTKHPGVYLYAVLYEIEKWTRNAEAAQAMKALRDAEIMDARAQDQGEMYSRARVRLQGVTP